MSSTLLNQSVRLLVVVIISAACSPDHLVKPSEFAVQRSAFPGASSLPLAVPYVGVMQPGRHIVCTSKFSVMPGHYVIEVANVEAGDQWANRATVPAGECAVVFETSRRTGFAAVVRITPGPVSMLSAVVTFTALCDPHCVPDCDPVTANGFLGTISKFYFTKPTPSRGFWSGVHGPHDPTPCFGFGNHGGTGTLDFALD